MTGVPVGVQTFFWSPTALSGQDPDKQTVTTLQAFVVMLQELLDAREIAFDFETTGLDWHTRSQACGIALACRAGKQRNRCWYVPFRHNTGEAQLQLEQIGPALGELLASPRAKVAHNIKFDEHFAKREGWVVDGPRYDTMIAARLYDENYPATLKGRAARDLGLADATASEQELEWWVVEGSKNHGMGLNEYRSLVGYSEVPILVCGHYACCDVDFTLRLQDFYEKQGVSTRYARIWSTEMDLTRVLHEMEENGLPIDVPYVEALQRRVREDKQQIEQELNLQLFGQPLNLASDSDLRTYLTQVLKVPLQKLTKAGREEMSRARRKPGAVPDLEDKLAVDGEVLEGFATEWPVLNRILAWREADKVDTTYTGSILERLDSKNLLHGDFQQVGTNTGRLSCRRPNLQNFSQDDPVRAAQEGGIDPYSVRRAFVVRGEKLPRLFFDYSQIELRVIAFYTRDPVMLDAYQKGEDIHSRTAKEVWGSDDKQYRKKAKVVNFGISFGLSETGFSRQAKIPLDEATKFMGIFFQKYKGIPEFKDRFYQYCRNNHCRFANLFGRPRYIPDLSSGRDYQRGRAERQAVGSLIQGTAAELTKESLVRIWKWAKETRLPIMLCSTVHDELWVDCPAEHLVEVSVACKRLMEDFPEFAPVPIVVAGEYTTTHWGQKKPLPL